MNTQAFPENTRRSIARELSRYYLELAGNEPDEPKRFSFARAMGEMLTERGLADGYEHEICQSAAMIGGRRHDPHRVVFPFSAFTRDLTAASAPGGGYLISQDKQRPVDVLRPWSVVARAGCTILDRLVGNPSIPRVITAATAQWTSTEATALTQSEPTIGEAVATPKHATGYMRFSRLLQIQADSFDRFVESQLLEAVGGLLDQTVIAGTGAAGQIAGITNTSGIGTQSGSSLAHTGTLAMHKQILDAGGIEERISWVGATDVQQTLAARERFSGGGRAIWDDGRILGRPAAATKHVAAGTLIGADWSRAIVCIWGPGFVVEQDPYTYFTTGRIAARIIVDCDLVLAPANAFSVSTSIT
ncbi:MAG: phage major capsid protein [Rubrivivax sp.]|nr:phage major capsid protein [Rubrivivax sp.]